MNMNMSSSSMSSSSASVSIILPVHNQADHIREVICQYESALKALPVPWEIILVTNACSDASPTICEQLSASSGASGGPIRWLDLPQGGWGRSVKHGLGAATGSILCYTNSARTSPETLLLTLQYAVKCPEAVVKVNRKLRENWRRRLGSLLYNLECRSLFDLSTWDINGTPKAFPRSFEQLLSLQSNDDLIDTEFGIVCRQEGYPIVEVPVFSTRRHGGKSTTNYHSAVKLYAGAYQLWRRNAKRGCNHND